ncbi:MAG: TIGR03790 family protein [Bryobacteraceae bacterium]
MSFVRGPGIRRVIAGLGLLVVFAAQASAQTQKAAPAANEGLSPARVLLVVNQNSPDSVAIGDYYILRRRIPEGNVCRIAVLVQEEIPRPVYNDAIAPAVSKCLREKNLVDSVYVIVTTLGVPLRIRGSNGEQGDQSSVDSELALLYFDLKTGKPHPIAGSIVNPFFGRRSQVFSHPEFPMYMVTRLAAYDVATVKAMIDRSLAAKNRGRVVLDLSAPDDAAGNNWLRDTAISLPADRVLFDESEKPVYGAQDVIGYASWGSNDGHRDRRFPGFRWLPGGIATQYVSSDGRTFARPPENWKSRTRWDDPMYMFGGSSQGLSADLLQEGATGASGHVYEPFLIYTPRPDHLLPAYYQGRTLAESFYLALPVLSWQNVILGDPLCSLGKP